MCSAFHWSECGSDGGKCLKNSDALFYYCCVSSAKFLLKKKYPHHFPSRWNAGSQFLSEKQIREMLPSLSVVKASSGEDHLCVSELLVGSFAFGVQAMNFMVPSFAYEVRTTWCILGLLGRVRSAARLGKIQASISNWCHVERLWWFGRLSWPLLLIVYIYFFGCQGWLAWAMNPVGGGVGLGLHVSAGQKTNSVSWLASLAPPLYKKLNLGKEDRAHQISTF